MVDREWAKPDFLLDLFLESFRNGERTKHLLKHLIVVALDEQALQYCLRAHPHCYLHRDFRSKFESLNPDGLVAGWRKRALVKEILVLGYNMVFTVSSLNATFSFLQPDFNILYSSILFFFVNHIFLLWK